MTTTQADSGEFLRQEAAFRSWIGQDPYPAAAGRYHLYVSLACPWSHRTVIVRALKGLEDAITIACAHPYRDERGWAFPGARHADPVGGFEYLAQAYGDDYDGRVSVPVLWDTETRTIVSNESADIVRMLGHAFDAYARHPELDLYPEPSRDEIDRIGEVVYRTVNNGVYRAGFARSQEAYDRAFAELFATLAELDALLGERRYLAGDVITEADWRLFPTLVRFDPVYYVHFRCNGRRLVDHANLWPYARELFQVPGIAETVALDEIKRHYYTTHDELNPKHIVPAGPLDEDWWAPPGRS